MRWAELQAAWKVADTSRELLELHQTVAGSVGTAIASRLVLLQTGGLWLAERHIAQWIVGISLTGVAHKGSSQVVATR